jgi:hypothetical protein
MNRTASLILVALIALASFALGRASAAPAPTNVPALVGELGEELGSPVVYLPGDDDGQKVYWLVFSDPAVEGQCRKIEVGSRVVVMGKVAAGGRYRYAVVTSIKADE